MCVMCSHVRDNYVSIGGGQSNKKKHAKRNQQLNQTKKKPAPLQWQTRVPKFPRSVNTFIIYFRATTKTPNRLYRIAIDGCRWNLFEAISGSEEENCVCGNNVHMWQNECLQIHYYLLRTIYLHDLVRTIGGITMFLYYIYFYRFSIRTNGIYIYIFLSISHECPTRLKLHTAYIPNSIETATMNTFFIFFDVYFEYVYSPDSYLFFFFIYAMGITRNLENMKHAIKYDTVVPILLLHLRFAFIRK